MALLVNPTACIKSLGGTEPPGSLLARDQAGTVLEGEELGVGLGLTLASCLVRKSTKPKPRWEPVPAIFLGSRTVFSSPKVL